MAAFEFRFQLRQPVFWVVALVFFLLAFASIAIDGLEIGSGGNVRRNAPYAIAQIHLILTLFSMFVTTGFVANVVVRDDETGFGPIIRATPVTKRDYLLGRFTGAFLAALLCFMTVPVAVMLATTMPWLDAQVLGPWRPGDYVFAYVVLAIPGLWLTATAFFALATVTRSMMWTYVGVVALLVVYVVSQVLLDRPEWQQIIAVVEPFGFGAVRLATRYWTATERNMVMPGLEGALLWNRVLWLGVGGLLLGCAYALFCFEFQSGRAARAKGRANGADDRPVVRLSAKLPEPEMGARTALAQLIARTAFELRLVFKSPALAVLMALGLFNAGINLWFAGDDLYAAEIYPVTRVVIETLFQSFSLVPMIVAIFYAGELVWRDRECRTHEIIDATPAPNWVMMVPKTLAIILALFVLLIGSALAGVLVQLAKGYTNFEVGKYVFWYVLPAGVDWSLIAVLAMFFQAVAPHKYVGWGLMLLYLIATLVATDIGLDHNLYLYGRSPAVPLSDMNGTGDFAYAAAWFRAYWTACALVLLLLAHALWRRGTETRLRPRLRRLALRPSGTAGAITIAATAVWVLLGGYIFLNTNVWNDYRSNRDNDQLTADIEKALLRYEEVPQPEATFVKLELDLDPHRPRLVSRGFYILKNKTKAPLDQVHVRWNRDLDLKTLKVEGARPVRDFGGLSYRIYRFDRPLAPGDERRLSFTSVIEQRGFTNSGGSRRIVDNGTFIDNSEFAPSIGMSRQGLLRDPATRRKYGLVPELGMARLEDAAARERNYAGFSWVRSDITVTTVADQTPIAPGYKVSDVVRGGRRTARFVTEAPIQFFFSVQSADYAVAAEDYRGIDLAVYYDRQHPWNVARMIRAMKVGLDYFQAAFGPYQFRQARIIEFPAYETYAQAFANTMPYSESLGFITNFDDPRKIDYVTYVTAHELAHQWWAHQVMGANAQGATVLSETLAQYSALMVMEKLYGADKIRKFLKFELDSYLKARASEAVEEPPLMRAEGQGYIHYRKGSLVMYLLKDRLGEDRVNRALRRLVRRHAFKGAPYPTSLDLVAALRAEARPDQQQLITDLFERITLYDIKTLGAEARRRQDGRYDVAVTVDIRKLYANGRGEERPASFAETFDFALFSESPTAEGFDRSDVLFFERRLLRPGVQTLTAIVEKAPLLAGVDPYNKWIDRNSDDNLATVLDTPR